MNPRSRIEEEFRLQTPHKGALGRLGIRTVEDLLYHFPVRYGDTAASRSIATLTSGDTAVIFGEVKGLKISKGFRTKIAMAQGMIDDGTGSIKAVWFNQPYLAKMLPDGALVRVEGKVSARKKKLGASETAQAVRGDLYLSNPQIERVEKLPTAVGDSLFGEDGPAHTLYPIYPESRGITSNWIYHSIQKIFKSGALEGLTDPLPKDMLERYNLPTLATAMIWIHAPQNAEHAAAARKRFALKKWS